MSVTIHHRKCPNPSPELLNFQHQVEEFKKIANPGAPPWCAYAPKPIIPENVAVSTFELNGVPCLKTEAKTGRDEKKAVMFIHGGGQCKEDGLLVLPEITDRSGIDGYSIEWTPAPDAAYPVQLEQCADLYKWLLNLGYEQIALTGPSFGGHLSLSLGQYCRKTGLPYPSSIAAVSAALDFSGAITPVNPDFLSQTVSGLSDGGYCTKEQVMDPCVSVCYGNYTDFCPVLFQAGRLESLVEWHEWLAEKLAKEQPNASVEVSIWEEMGHGFAFEGGFYPEGYAGREQVIEFILGHFR